MSIILITLAKEVNAKITVCNSCNDDNILDVPVILSPECEMDKFVGNSSSHPTWDTADFDDGQVIRNNTPDIFESGDHTNAAWVLKLNVTTKDTGRKVRVQINALELCLESLSSVILGDLL